MLISKAIKTAALLLVVIFFLGNETKTSQIFGLWQLNRGIFASTNQGLEIFNLQKKWQLVIASTNDRITAVGGNKRKTCVGTYNGFLHLISDSSQTTIELPVQPNGQPYLVNGIVFNLKFWWVSTLEGVVFQINKTGSYVEIPFLDTKTNRKKNILAIAKDNDNHLWVSTLDGIFFLTDIYKNKQKKYTFLASSSFGTKADKILGTDLGTVVFTTQNKKTVLYLGTLSASLMDGIKKELNLPKEFETNAIIESCFYNGSLWLLGKNTLYELKNYNWISHSLQDQIPENINGIAIIDNYLIIGSNYGSFHIQFL